MSEFSINQGKEFLFEAGDKRVSKDAATALNEKLERFAGDVAELAVQEAQNADRKTVKAEDVKKALT